jgi:signal peptidase I
MSGAGRGVTPGAEPAAGSDREAGSPAVDQAQTVHSDHGPAGDSGQADVPPENEASASAGSAGGAGAAGGTGAGGSAGAAGRKTAPRGTRGGRFFRELVILIVVALVIAVAIKTYAVQAFFIPSGSMENTLEINDRVLVNKIVYDIRSIHRGDIVVFNGDGSWDPGPAPTSSNFVSEFGSGFASMFGFGHPGDILIKRVIGVPGDRVVCCDAQGRVTVNGIPLNEQVYLYPDAAPSQARFIVVVPPGRLWVMGDNRPISADSRVHEGDPGGGTIPETAVIGRAFVIIWPPSRWRILPIPATFEQPKLNASSAVTPASSAVTPASATGDPSAGAVLSARLESSNPALPLVLGFALALPVSWLQRRARIRATRIRANRRRTARPADLPAVSGAISPGTADKSPEAARRVPGPPGPPPRP